MGGAFVQPSGLWLALTRWGSRVPLSEVPADVGIPQQFTAKPRSPVSFPAKPLFGLPFQGSLFLDICAGVSSLFAAMVIPVLAILALDILLNPSPDLLDAAFFEHVLRLAFFGIAAVAHGSPPRHE